MREAPGKGNGVFAARPFAKADVILRFERGPVIDRLGLDRLNPWEREHLSEIGIGLWRVLPEPRCFLNHACDPNAVSTEAAVYALRPISTDEEITIDYRLNAYDDGTGVWVMDCACDPARGPHQVVGDFFSLPPSTQERYLEWAPSFIKAPYTERHPQK
ncbi:MAG: SET domain-containing protein [Chloroflexota bacterium]|nr:SET domain-containing protein [Chloroflexota bacterium]